MPHAEQLVGSGLLTSLRELRTSRRCGAGWFVHGRIRNLEWWLSTPGGKVWQCREMLWWSTLQAIRNKGRGALGGDQL